MSHDDWTSVIAVHLNGCFNVSKAAEILKVRRVTLPDLLHRDVLRAVPHFRLVDEDVYGALPGRQTALARS